MLLKFQIYSDFNMESTTAIAPKTNVKVPARSIIAYGVGDAGCNFCWTYVGNYLMFFYSNVLGVGMTAIATLFLLSRIWDAINDPIVGMVSDRTRSKWGRYRPWLLFGAPICSLVMVLTFWGSSQWSEGWKIAYMAITYCTLVLAYTCVNLPYGTLCSAMTQNMDERAKINTSRSVAAMLAINVINIITIPLIKLFGDGQQASAKGYLIVTILYGLMFSACHLFCFKNTKEVVEPVEEKKYSVWEQLKAVSRNTPYMLALLGQFMFGLVLYIRNSDLVYYFTYVEGNGDFLTIYSLITIVPALIGAAAFPIAFRIIGNKGRTASFFAFTLGVSMFMLYFFSPTSSPVWFYLFGALTQFFFSGFNTAIYAVIPDCVEYGEWKTGVRNEGFQYAFISLGNKLGMALGTAGLALWFGLTGFDSDAATQAGLKGLTYDAPAASIDVMHHVFSTIPGVLWILTGIFLLFYKLDKKTYNNILGELDERHGN